MSSQRYLERLIIQAVNHVTEKELPVADVAADLEQTPGTTVARGLSVRKNAS